MQPDTKKDWVVLFIAGTIGSFVAIQIAGCTGKANKIADAAFQRGVGHVDDNVYDLYVLATQKTVDYYSMKAREAAEAGDADLAAKAVENAITEYDKITWIAREQYGRGREMLRISQRYIWQQRGWFSIVNRDWQEAKRRLGDEDLDESADDTSEGD